MFENSLWPSVSRYCCDGRRARCVRTDRGCLTIRFFIGEKELEPDVPISALLSVDGDDGVGIVQIYLYESSAVQLGYNDAATIITKEIAALDGVRRSGKIRK